MTRNHDLRTPDRGTTDWHTPLNGNFERLDRAVEIRDVEDNLDNYEARDGAKFLAIDTEVVYVADGDGGWREMKSTGLRNDGVETSVNAADAAEWIRFAESAEEIQPLIDELATPNDDGTQGGIVKLGPGVYEPETTIWLKAGVSLEGTSRLDGLRHRGVRTDVASGGHHGTVLTTASMGSEPTFRHDGENPHDHFPVVANERAPPLEMDEGDLTEDEKRYWGHNVALRNLTIDAGPKQRWSEENTYHGVYDGCMFSRSNDLLVENVTTKNVLGYGGFFNGCHNVRDLGSVWQGGATDFHGSALTIHTTYPPESTTYTDEAAWDVDVIGPPPAVEIFAHGVKFVSGGWSNATVTARERTFIGDEQAYWDGEAPIVEPESEGNRIFSYDHGRCYVEDYHVEATDAYDRELVGFASDYQYLMLNNCSTKNTKRACTTGRQPNKITDCHFDDTEIGLDPGSNLPSVNGLVISNAEKGFRVSNSHSNTDGTIDRLEFRNVDVGLFGQDNNEPIYFNNTDFTGAETPMEREYDSVHLGSPAGLE